MIELDVLSKSDVVAAAEAPPVEAEGQPKQWRSLSGLQRPAAARALARHEFLPAATAADAAEREAAQAEEPERRTFMKTLAATMALAGVGLAGCRRPVEKVLPYARKPEDVIPGIPNFYATAMPLAGVFHPLLVESHTGRPTKVEGNPEHPVSQGASGAFAQASVLNLYDPDRSRVVRYDGAASDWTAFLAAARELRARGARLAVVAEPSASLVAAGLREDLLAAYPGARWVSYAPNTAAQAAGVGAAAGRPLRPLFRFSRAQTIVSFDADFLEDAAASVWNSREYAQSRRVMEESDEMSRLYVVESSYTTTGGMADHRLRMKASDVPYFAAAVAAELGEDAGPIARRVGGSPRVRAFAEAIAEDARQGQTAFVAGETQPPAVHALAARLNATYAGDAVSYLDTGVAPEPPMDEALVGVLRDAAAGRLDALLTIGVNAAYDFPAALQFDEAVAAMRARDGVLINLSSHRDETAELATWHLPRAHYLESWDLGRALDGTVTVMQPLIAPLYEDAHSDLEVLAALATGGDVAGYDLVRDTARGLLSGSFEDAWRTLLHDGFLPGTAFAGGAPSPASGAVTALPVSDADDIELVIRADSKLYDGTFSNNAWMLELPDAVTKVTWDNVAAMSPATAALLGVEFDDAGVEGGEVEAGKIYASLVTIATPDGAGVTLPAWVQPGHADGSITVTTGWGRALGTDRILEGRGLLSRITTVDTDHWREGPVANEVGQPVAFLRPAPDVYVLPSVGVEVTGGGYLIATTQDHGQMEGRPIVRSAPLAEYRADPDFARDAVKPIADTPWQDYPPAWGQENSPPADPRVGEALYSDHQWGMTVDLNACSGCNACVVACQAENNVSVVGKDEVSRGREMHWLRLDRYYVGDDADEPEMVQMAMMCQHCEYAPCESVCPVAATVHSPDGLNVMVYNRCIGTRYCSNNCPYKVRRYNWFNWMKAVPMEARMQLNPDVTTRFRGVMEKCTWCVQRIREANKYAHIESRHIEEGEVQTACQQACPAGAIVFGDLTNPDSEVSRMKRNPRSYELLEELNVKPRLSYLARLSNPNPRLLAALGQPADPTTPEQPVPARESA